MGAWSAAGAQEKEASRQSSDGGISAIVTAIVSWATSMGGTDAMARLYRQGDTAVLSQFFPGSARPGPPPFVATTFDGRWTLGLIPGATWRAAAAEQGFPSMGAQYTEIHHMFPGMLLTDALRRSGF